MGYTARKSGNPIKTLLAQGTEVDVVLTRFHLTGASQARQVHTRRSTVETYMQPIDRFTSSESLGLCHDQMQRLNLLMRPLTSVYRAAELGPDWHADTE